ncbi:hypothetical protein BRC86_08710 [Halobacteriales archaeon QS_3_64_16]|nr:MAG: hypothetical protein BRC86_08710 [Halobacteriales archaeon QS_3_64_16]
MVTGAFFRLTVLFALITGTAAGILSLLTWEIFRQSPFGRAIFLLSGVLSAFTIYHVVLVIWEMNTVLDQVLKSVVFTGVAVFVWVMVRYQRRLRPHTGARD